MAKQPRETAVEQALEQFFHAVEPDPTFGAALEQRLLAQVVPQAERPRESPLLIRVWQGLVRPFRHHRWATVPLVLLLAVLLSVLAIGPQRVLAEVLNALGYVPGVGFVDLEQSRVLVAPVEQTRDGVTLRITEVLAKPDGTDVVLRSEGVPPEPQGPREQENIEAFQPQLRLPDGSLLEGREFTLRYGEGTLHFPPLPEDVYRVTLEIPKLPLVAEGAAPEAWSVPLTLLPASGEVVGALYAQPYQPTGATDMHEGITLRVLEAAHSPEETALTVEVDWDNPEWDLRGGIGGRRLPELRDDLGHVMSYQPPSNQGSVSVMQVEVEVNPDASPPPEPPMTWQETVTFPPVSPSAQQLTLWVDMMDVRAPADATFTLNLGENPQVGDEWQLNEQLDVLGFAVRVVSARLERDEEGLRLMFQIENLGSDAEGRELVGLSLQGLSFSAQEGGGSGWSRGSNRMSRYLYLTDVPSGEVLVGVTEASFWVEGPWRLSWAVPGGADGSTAPVVQAQPASDTQSGVTLQVEEAVLTDRLTQVRLGAGEMPEGMRFRRPLRVDPATLSGEKGLYLADNLGGRYDLGWGTRWHPPQSAAADEHSWLDEMSLTFPAVSPLADRITLHVPNIEAIVPDSTTFEVTVPEEVVFHPGEYGSFVSDPWVVDLPLNVGGFTFRFTEALLRQDDREARLELRSEMVAGNHDGRQLTGLDLAAIFAPDGRAVPLDHAYALAGPTNAIEMMRGRVQVSLSFDITHPDRAGWLPGRYRVDLNGATVSIGGSWELTWVVR